MRRRHLDHPPDRPRRLGHPEPRTAEAAGGTRAHAPARSTSRPRREGRDVRTGITALTQYVQREGHLKVPRQHTETVVIDGQEHTVKPGIFLSNHKSRRAKLTVEQREQFAALGLDWATA